MARITKYKHQIPTGFSFLDLDSEARIHDASENNTHHFNKSRRTEKKAAYWPTNPNPQANTQSFAAMVKRSISPCESNTVAQAQLTKDVS